MTTVTEYAIRYADGEHFPQDSAEDAAAELRHANYRYSNGDAEFAGAHIVSRTITTTDWK